MSTYTTEVRYICEQYAGFERSQDYPVDRVIDAAIPKIFENFPIYDERYRNVLERKILKHYYTREIGLETVGLWKLKLNTKLQEIMPYYNKMYRAMALEYNPLYDVDYTRTHEGEDNTRGTESYSGRGENNNSGTGSTTTQDSSTSNTTTESSSGTTAQGVVKNSDTPQGSLQGLMNDNYMSAASVSSSEGTGENSGTEQRADTSRGESANEFNNNGTYSDTHENERVFNSTESYVEHVVGKQGSVQYAKMVKDYMDSIMNVDMRIINELNELFMNVW